MNKYEDRYVAFIDILGFSELVGRSESEPEILERLVNILNALVANSETLRSIHTDKPNAELGALEATTFSDNIVISAKVNPLGISNLLDITAFISNYLLRKGVLTRGGISRGKLIHSSKIVMGSGLISAYNLESKIAVYPRILINDNVRNDIISDKKLYAWKKENLRRDFDGLWHLHVFAESNMQSISTDGNTQALLSIPLDFMDAARVEIVRSYHNAKNLSVKAKVAWLAQYFNTYALERNLPLIDLPN